MTNDFSKMSRSELRQYLIQHRNDEAAWEEFVSRPKPNSQQYPPPDNEEGQRIMEQAFHRKIRTARFRSNNLSPVSALTRYRSQIRQVVF